MFSACSPGGGEGLGTPWPLVLSRGGGTSWSLVLSGGGVRVGGLSSPITVPVPGPARGRRYP